MKTVIRNGMLVARESVIHQDVAFADGRIHEIGSDLHGDQEYDARGCYVIPGGVDMHTHLQSRQQGLASADTFASGTTAAAWGGTTTVVDFCEHNKTDSLPEALHTWHKRAGDTAMVDYGFHSIVADVRDSVLTDIPNLQPEHGVSSVKVFLAYRGESMVSDLAFAQVLDAARRANVLTMVHAENGDLAWFLQQQLLKQGHTEPRFHIHSRPNRVEAEAVERAIGFAEVLNAPVYIVHVSCAESLDAIRRGRERGVRVFAETCPQYLFITAEQADIPGFDGARYVFTPPPRTEADQLALWNALADGSLDVVSSDHSAWNLKGGKDHGAHDFTQMPNGGHGVEERLTLLFQGVVENRISITRWVDLVATTPADIYGLPQKGRIEPGADADLVIWDPEYRHTLSVNEHHSAIDYNMYEGLQVQGIARSVFLRGEPVILNRTLVRTEPHGRFLHREPFTYSR